jgi:hypothetical protein
MTLPLLLLVGASLSMLALALGGCAAGAQTIPGARAEANLRECVDQAKAAVPHTAGPKPVMTEIYRCMAARGYNAAAVDALPVSSDVLGRLLERPSSGQKTP